jgi:outer membrane protein assembly factor BamB
MWHRGLLVAVVVLAFMSLGMVDHAVADGTDGLDLANDSQQQDPGGVTVDERLTDAEGTVEVFVRFEPAADATTRGELRVHAANTQADLQAVAARTRGLTVENRFWLANAVLVRVDTATLPVTALARIDGVERLAPNVEMETMLDPPERPSPTGEGAGETEPPDRSARPGAGEHGNTTYGLDQVRAPTVWEEYGTKGAGTRVAVLDSGVDPDHPALDLAGWAKFGANGTELDEPPQDVDPQGHGTHVSGTVAGGAANGTHIGVAPETELYHAVALRECDPACVVTVAQLVASMEWGVANNADVLSMSIGIPGAVEAFIEPVRNANNVGVAVVVSSGNEGEGLALSPANVYDAIGVGAAAEDGTIAGFSSGDEYETASFWGEAAPADWPEKYTVPSVSGPGVDVLSSLPNNSYGRYSGTSMATPHVAGVLALAQSATDQQVGPDALRTALEATGWKPDGWPTPEWAADSRYGFGHVDAPAVVDYLDAPTASLQLAPRRPSPGETVTFGAELSFGDIESYAWEFTGDGETDATGESVTHSFPAEGVYNVTLTVSAAGETDTTVRTVRVAPKPFEELWTRDVGAPTRGGQTVVNGTVFVGGIEGHALNASTGNGTSLPTRGPVWTAPTVVEGTVYFGTAGDENRVYAYDTGERQLAWRTRTGDSVRASPTVVADTVYAGSDDGVVYAFDADTGEQRWAVETGGPVRASPTVVETHPEPGQGAWTVLVGSDDGSVYALDGATGEQRWTVETGDRVRAAPTVAGKAFGVPGAERLVYVGSDDGTVRALGLETGTEKWVVETGTPVRAAPTVAGGTVYVGGDDTTVYAFDATTGESDWTAETGGLVRGGPTVANGTVYVGATDGNLYALDATTGEQRWTDNLFGAVHTAPTVLNGTVYVSTDRGAHAIETEHAATSAGSRVALGTLGHGPAWADQSPTALFETDPVVPEPGETVTLDGTTTVGTVESYAWEFTGDGETDATGETVTHSFDTTGEHPVTLTVTDGNGSSDSRAAAVDVAEELLAGLTVETTDPETHAPVSVDAGESAGTIETYEWGFGNGETTTGETVTHTYTTYGEFEVTLTLTDIAGRTATATETVAVDPAVAPVIGDQPPRDLTGDGLHRDVDGNGAFDIFDVQALFTGLDGDPVQSNVWAFDFTGSGAVGIFDVQALFEDLDSVEG